MLEIFIWIKRYKKTKMETIRYWYKRDKNDPWYDNLNKSPLNPPNKVFGITWAILWCTIGFGATTNIGVDIMSLTSTIFIMFMPKSASGKEAAAAEKEM